MVSTNQLQNGNILSFARKKLCFMINTFCQMNTTITTVIMRLEKKKFKHQMTPHLYICRQNFFKAILILLVSHGLSKIFTIFWLFLEEFHSLVCCSSHSAFLATNNLLKTQQCLKGFMLNYMMTTIKAMVIMVCLDLQRIMIQTNDLTSTLKSRLAKEES